MSSPRKTVTLTAVDLEHLRAITGDRSKADICRALGRHKATRTRADCYSRLDWLRAHGYATSTKVGASVIFTLTEAGEAAI